MAKKSLYIFLTSLLGVLLFLVVHQVVFFIYVYMVDFGLVNTDMNFYQFLATEYFSLIIFLMLGSWYGIWLGLYWFKRVYEDQNHQGFVHHLAANYFYNPRPAILENQMAQIKERLEENLWQLEALAKDASQAPLQEIKPRPIKRRVIRKKAPKKLA